MKCKVCGAEMVDPRGGSGSWSYGYTPEGYSVVVHKSTHDYRCTKCPHFERVQKEERFQSKKHWWDKDVQP